VEGELGDLVDLVTPLEQPAGRFVPQIVEAQILDAEQLARPGEGGANALGITGNKCGLVRGWGSTIAQASGV